MKKILYVSLLALGILSLSQQQASAWINAKFGIGMNFGWQSGGNCVLWGLAQGQQPPPGYGPYEVGEPAYSFAPNFYQPPNPDFFGGHAYSAPAAANQFTAPAPTPVT